METIKNALSSSSKENEDTSQAQQEGTMDKIKNVLSPTSKDSGATPEQDSSTGGVLTGEGTHFANVKDSQAQHVPGSFDNDDDVRYSAMPAPLAPRGQGVSTTGPESASATSVKSGIPGGTPVQDTHGSGVGADSGLVGSSTHEIAASSTTNRDQYATEQNLVGNDREVTRRNEPGADSLATGAAVASTGTAADSTTNRSDFNTAKPQPTRGLSEDGTHAYVEPTYTARAYTLGSALSTGSHVDDVPGPHVTNTANRLDPSLVAEEGSGLTGSGATGSGLTGSGVTGSGITGSGLTSSEKAVGAGGIGAGGLASTGAYDSGLSSTGARDSGLASLGTRESGLTSTGARDSELTSTGARDTGIGGTPARDVGLGTAGAAAVGGTALASRDTKADEPSTLRDTTTTSTGAAALTYRDEPTTTRDTTTSTTGGGLLSDKDDKKDESHTGRNAALGAGGLAAAGGAIYEADKHSGSKDTSDKYTSTRDTSKSSTEHEHDDGTSEKKEKRRSLLGIFSRDKDKDKDSKESKESKKLSKSDKKERKSSDHSRERDAAAVGGTAVAGAGAYEATKDTSGSRDASGLTGTEVQRDQTLSSGTVGDSTTTTHEPRVASADYTQSSESRGVDSTGQRGSVGRDIGIDAPGSASKTSGTRIDSTTADRFAEGNTESDSYGKAATGAAAAGGLGAAGLAGERSTGRDDGTFDNTSSRYESTPAATTTSASRDYGTTPAVAGATSSSAYDSTPATSGAIDSRVNEPAPTARTTGTSGYDTTPAVGTATASKGYDTTPATGTATSSSAYDSTPAAAAATTGSTTHDTSHASTGHSHTHKTTHFEPDNNSAYGMGEPYGSRAQHTDEYSDEARLEQERKQHKSERASGEHERSGLSKLLHRSNPNKLHKEPPS